MILKKIFNVLRRIKGVDTHNWFRGNLNINTPEEINNCISKLIQSGKPFVAGRLGSVEIKPLIYFNVLENLSLIKKIKLYINGDIDYIFNRDRYINEMMSILYNNAGFFPQNNNLIKEFSDLYTSLLKNIDVLGVWLNEYLLKEYFNNKITFCELGSLEPYDYANPWTKYLKGKKVLVISPFTESIKKQYNKKQLIWENQDILPDFQLETITAVQSIAGNECGFATWFEALEDMKNQMNKIDFDIALIGCGAYGLPLAEYAKSSGKQAVHLGGPLQILFGIKGKRWDELPAVNKFYNEAWVYPDSSETPKNNKNVEGGCYW